MTEAAVLKVTDLCVNAVSGVQAVHNASVEIRAGETHVVVADPDQDTAAFGAAVVGSPNYRVRAGTVTFDGTDLAAWPTHIRVAAGVMAIAAPPSGPAGISHLSILQAAARTGQTDQPGVMEIRTAAAERLRHLGCDPGLVSEDIGADLPPAEQLALGFSHALVGRPSILIIDLPAFGEGPETTGVLLAGLARLRVEQPNAATLIMSRDEGLIDRLEPDHAHLLRGGRIEAIKRSSPQTSVRDASRGAGEPAVASSATPDGNESMT